VVHERSSNRRCRKGVFCPSGFRNLLNDIRDMAANRRGKIFWLGLALLVFLSGCESARSDSHWDVDRSAVL